MLSLVIPTYKEAKNIDILLPRIYKTIQPVIPGLRIWVIDDDSNDGINEVVEKHNQLCGGIINLRIRKDRKGLASAWKEGIKASTTPVVGVMDADLVHDPKDILRMVEALKATDMVIGSRYLPHQLSFMHGKSPVATYLSIWGQYLSRFILGIKVWDMSHSLRVFHREVFEKAESLLMCQGNAMMVEFTFHACRLNFKIAEIPIQYGQRLYGKTKLGIIKEGSRFLRILVHLRNSYPAKKDEQMACNRL